MPRVQLFAIVLALAVSVCLCKKQAKQSVEEVKEAAERGHGPAQLALGNRYFDGNAGVERSVEDAFKWWMKAAKQGNAEAQWRVGNCYHSGEGVGQDYEKAFEWFLKGAEQKFVGAMFNAAVCYDNGIGVTANNDEAIKYYRKVAEKGNAEAQFNLGQCYEKAGKMKEAVKWWRKAGSQDHKLALFNVGNALFNALGGVRLAEDEAITYFKKSSKLGYEGADYNLGVAYFKGRGVEKDVEMAKKFWQTAADNGHEVSKQNLENIAKAEAEGRPLDDEVLGLEDVSDSNAGEAGEPEVEVDGKEEL